MRLLRQLAELVRHRRRGVRRIPNVVRSTQVRIGVDRAAGAWTLAIGESSDKRVCDTNKDSGITLLGFAEAFNLEPSAFARLEDAHSDEMLALVQINSTEQLLDRVVDLFERRAYVPPPAMPLDGEGVPIKGF